MPVARRSRKGPRGLASKKTAIFKKLGGHLLSHGDFSVVNIRQKINPRVHKSAQTAAEVLHEPDSAYSPSLGMAVYALDLEFMDPIDEEYTSPSEEDIETPEHSGSPQEAPDRDELRSTMLEFWDTRELYRRSLESYWETVESQRESGEFWSDRELLTAVEKLVYSRSSENIEGIALRTGIPPRIVTDSVRVLESRGRIESYEFLNDTWYKGSSWLRRLFYLIVE